MSEPDIPKIISIRGGAIVAPGEPVADVVKVCEDLLEMARSGEIKSVVAAMQRHDGSVSGAMGGELGPTLLGELELIRHRVVQLLLEA